MTRKTLVGSLLAVGLAIPAVFMAAPAQAAVSNCPSGATCLWEDAGPGPVALQRDDDQRGQFR